MTRKRKLAWVAVLYFAEGFPFGIVNRALPAFFKVHGVRLTHIGLLTLAGLPWTLKFLWAPAVDLWGQRRVWVVGCQALLTLGLLAILAVDPSHVSAIVWTVMLWLSFSSATQDIAIDAYTIELLDEKDEKEMGSAGGVRVAAYNIALSVAGGLLVALPYFLSWSAAFVGRACCRAAFPKSGPILSPGQVAHRGKDCWSGRSGGRWSNSSGIRDFHSSCSSS
jgi:PAT family beta-lactamase induction signal transducer AmpG